MRALNSEFSAFRARMNSYGANEKEEYMNSTKIIAREKILNSPTRSDVELLQLEEQLDKTYKLTASEVKPSIVSDKETFYKRTILFLPDEGIQLGSYLKYDNKYYLTTNISDIDGYPQAFVEYCNQTIKIKGEETKVLVGKDSLGRPQYKTVKVEFNLPCVATSKIYSVLDNSQMPLPEGAILIYLPYHEKINVPVNYEFQIQDTTYQVTTVNKVNVLSDELGNKYGYIEIRGQSDVKKPWQ